ncbi:MAG: hypothetical protein HN737_12960 [Desulfobacterales bacterium]|jgi:hypothetical protein|nr:hypothetical protein [Desulfobacteraceae bacterium]MBT4365137.1 hypothetical protein [Desulfobacteraceae bacterium]MBT7698306.1 hypothetical protein [Desulfobacterales bacterium]
MKIEIKLKHHCIKTGAEKKYNKLIKQYFISTLSELKKVDIEAQIEALKFFLENADFNRIRAAYPELSGFDELSITLMIPENHHEIKIAYKDIIINPEWRISHE